MKITTKSDALFAQMQTVSLAASTRSAVQALSGVPLSAKGGAIELRATDMEIGLRVPLEGEGVRDRAVAPPARLRGDGALGVAGRDAPGPHGHPRVRLGERPADGRHGLVPAVRQGDEARVAAAGLI